MHEALALVRDELGPEAAVLHTRELRMRRLFGWLRGPRQIEVTASRDVNVPSRFPTEGIDLTAQPPSGPAFAPPGPGPSRPTVPVSPAMRVCVETLSSTRRMARMGRVVM